MGLEQPEIMQIIIELYCQYLAYIGIVYCALTAMTKRNNTKGIIYEKYLWGANNDNSVSDNMG